MTRSFNESTFVVTFLSECSESKLIEGWDNVLDYINKEIDVPDRNAEGSFFNPCCDVHDEDSWTQLESYARTDVTDLRHVYDSEIDEGVTLRITRITEYEE